MSGSEKLTTPGGEHPASPARLARRSKHEREAEALEQAHAILRRALTRYQSTLNRIVTERSSS